MILGKPIAVSFDHIVNQGANFINRQFTARMRVKHSCLIDVILFAGQRRIDGYLMDTDLTQVKRGQLVRKCANMARLDTALVGKAGDLNAAVRRKIIN